MATFFKDVEDVQNHLRGLAAEKEREAAKFESGRTTGRVPGFEDKFTQKEISCRVNRLKGEAWGYTRAADLLDRIDAEAYEQIMLSLRK